MIQQAVRVRLAVFFEGVPIQPKKEKLSALVADHPNGGDDEVDKVMPRLNPLQLINTIITVDKQPTFQDGLMYVAVKINGIETYAMVNWGATNNFLAKREVKKFGLDLAQRSCRIKAVNSEAMSVPGAATASLRVGLWEGRCSFVAIPLDDFNVILGADFLLKEKAVVIPYLKWDDACR